MRQKPIFTVADLVEMIAKIGEPKTEMQAKWKLYAERELRRRKHSGLKGGKQQPRDRPQASLAAKA